MKRATETRVGSFRLSVVAVAILALAGCEEGAGSAFGTSKGTETPTSQPNAKKSADRDVEAPEVFELTEAGLWDGRPSLGGIWVAHPDVTDPERVTIRNTSNGKSTVGALFRRERDLPGPRLQVSSGAAEKLGMLAGAPTSIHVVALRRETVEETPEPAKETPSTEEAADTDTVTEASASAGANEPNAEESEVEKPAKRKWWQKKEPDSAVVAGTAVAATAAANAATAEADEPAKTVIEAADAPLEPASATEQPVKKKKWWQKDTKGEITETKLDPIAGAAAAIEASDPSVQPTETAASTSASASKTSSLSKPYVQVGTFNVEANANAAADKVRKAGLPAEVLPLSNDDKTIWRVLAGPAQNRAERNEIRAKMAEIGFADAYVVKN